MNYELAKTLKDAGLKFYTGRIGAFFWKSEEGIEVEDSRGVLHCNSDEREDLVVIPTLEELIEACGMQFWKLTKRLGTKNGWVALARHQMAVKQTAQPHLKQSQDYGSP